MKYDELTQDDVWYTKYDEFGMPYSVRHSWWRCKVCDEVQEASDEDDLEPCDDCGKMEWRELENDELPPKP